MFNFFKKKNKNNIILSDFKKLSEARCPKCGNLLTENNDYLECINTLSGVCNFKINRIINGKKITLEMFTDFQNIPNTQNVYNIVNSERDKLIKYYKNMDKEMQERYSKKDIFFKDAIHLKGCCPKHAHRTLYRKGDIVKCGHCGFEMNTVFCGVNFSDEEINTMLPNTISNEHIFTDENGKSIKTVAFLDFDENGRRNGNFKLATNLLEMEERYLKFVYIYPEGKQNWKNSITLEEYLIKKDDFFRDAKEIDLHCPNHLISKGKLYKKGDTIRCDKCQFKMNTSFNGVKFSHNELENMLAKTISNEHIFIDENGKPIKAAAFLDFDENAKYNGEFKLAIDQSKLEEHHLKFVYIYPEGIKNKMKSIRLGEYLKNKKNNS